MFNRFISLVLAAVCAIALSHVARAAVEIEGDPKIAMIYLTPAYDGGWTESIERGRVAMEKALGLDIAYTEDVPGDKTKVRQVIDLYAKRGYNIIIGTAWDYGEAFAEAAADYPNVAFLNIAGETSAENLESFYGKTYEAWYLAGMAAASVTKTKKIAYIGGYPLSVVNWDMNAFQRGANVVDPEVHVIATFVNTWHDPVKEGQAAQALIEQGADVIGTGLSAASVPAATEKAGVYFVGFQNDMSHLAPNGHVTSVIFNWEGYLIPVVQDIIAKKWTSQGTPLIGLEYDMMGLTEYSSLVPEDVQAEIRTAQEKIKAGTLTPFDGPVVKQDGTVVAAEGTSLTVDDIWGMDYFVEGVIGTMPAQ